MPLPDYCINTHRKENVCMSIILNLVNLFNCSKTWTWGYHRPVKKFCVQRKAIQSGNHLKTIWHAHPTLQKAIDYRHKVERELLLVEWIQQMEFDTVMSIDFAARNDPMT